MSNGGSTSQLFQRLQSQDPDAQRQFYRERERWVKAAASAASPEDREEIAQDVFLIAFRKAPDLSSEQDLLRYMRAVVRNKLRDRWRRKKRRIESERDTQDTAERSDSGPSPDMGIAREEFFFVLVISANLTDQERLALEMDIEGYSNEQVAKKLQVSAKRAANIKSEARRKVRDFLGLSEDEHTVLELRGKGASEDGIAQELEVSPETAKSLLIAALRKAYKVLTRDSD